MLKKINCPWVHPLSNCDQKSERWGRRPCGAGHRAWRSQNQDITYHQNFPPHSSTPVYKHSHLSYLCAWYTSYLSRPKYCLLGISDEAFFAEQVSISTLCQLLKRKLPIAAATLNQLSILKAKEDTCEHTLCHARTAALSSLHQIHNEVSPNNNKHFLLSKPSTKVGYHDNICIMTIRKTLRKEKLKLENNQGYGVRPCLKK